MQFSVGLDRSVQLVVSILHLHQINLAQSKQCVNVVRWFSSTGIPANDGLLELSEKKICKHLHLHESDKK